jgi:hypothetical protein
MKAILLLIMISGAVFAQSDLDKKNIDLARSPEYTAPVEAIQKVLGQKRSYDISVDAVGAGIVTDRPLETVIVRVRPSKKEISAQALADQLGAVLSDVKHAITVTVQYIQATHTAGEPRYYYSPIRVTTFCSGNFCSSTATGGNVYTLRRLVFDGFITRQTGGWRNY